MNRRVDPRNLKPDQWSVAEAKARFSEVVARARAGDPQHISRYGKDEVVVVSARDWERLAQPKADQAWLERPGGLLELFAPIRDLGLDELIEGMRGDLRDPGLG